MRRAHVIIAYIKAWRRPVRRYCARAYKAAARPARRARMTRAAARLAPEEAEAPAVLMARVS